MRRSIKRPQRYADEGPEAKRVEQHFTAISLNAGGTEASLEFCGGYLVNAILQ